MTASQVFRLVVLSLWLLSSIGGLTYALTHFRRAKEAWEPAAWEGMPEADNAKFHRVLARLFLGYFVLVVLPGVVSVFWPTPPQPLRVTTVINTVSLIAANALWAYGIHFVRDYEKEQRG